MLLCLGYCEYSYREHWGECIFWNYVVVVVVFSGYVPRNGIAGLYAVFNLVSKETSILFSIIIVPNYLPTNSVGGLPFLHTLFSIIVCRLFNDGHSDQCDMIPDSSFNLHLFNDQ